MNLLNATYSQLLATFIRDHLHFLPKTGCESVLFSCVSVGGERNTNRESGAKGFQVKGVCTQNQWLLFYCCLLEISVGGEISLSASSVSEIVDFSLFDS